MRTLKLVRRATTALWVGLLVGLVALVAGADLAPLLGHDVFIIRGGSMSPAIPLGSLVIDERVAPSDVHAGDVVTVRAHDTVLVTHRVLSVEEGAEGRSVQLKGDFNPAPDPTPVPASNVVGRVVVHVPFAGFLLAMLSRPMGIVSVLSMVISLFLVIHLLELAEQGQRTPAPHGRAAEAGLPA